MAHTIISSPDLDAIVHDLLESPIISQLVAEIQHVSPLPRTTKLSVGIGLLVDSPNSAPIVFRSGSLDLHSVQTQVS